MNAKHENSMMVALADLHSDESARLAREAAKQREEAARQRQQQEALKQELQRQLVAQEEQRSAEQAAAREHLALKSESLMLKQHSHELEHRLRVSQAERELLSSQLGALQDGISKNSQRWRWRLVLGVAASLTFGLLGVIGVATEFSRIQQKPSSVQLQVEAQLAAKDQVAAARANHAALALMQQQVSTLEQQLAALHRAAEASLQASTLLSHSGGRSGPHSRLVKPVPSSATAASCQDDPLCGVVVR